jgi:hypothetical protein
MARAERTVYRLLKHNFTKEELSVYFTPSPEESDWAKQNTWQMGARLNILVNLKVFQYLGYFAPFAEIPESILFHVRKSEGGSDTIRMTYSVSKTLYRHRDLIRDYLQILPWGRGALHVALGKAVELASIMDNPIDC